MIHEIKFEKGYVTELPGVNRQYYGIDYLDNPECNNDYLNKECTIDIPGGEKAQGVIIGYEENESMCDNYYIVYIPSISKVMYGLEIDANFIKSIKICRTE